MNKFGAMFSFQLIKNKIYYTYGFSLIELLVVISIIGTLSAIGMVGYSGYIEHSKDKIIENNIIQLNKVLISEFLKCELSNNAIILGNFNCNSSQPPSANIVKNFLNNKNLNNPNSNNSAVTANACNPGNISIQNSKCVGTFQLTSVNSKGKKINNIYSTKWTPVNTNVKTCWKTVNTNSCTAWTNVNSSNNTVWKNVVTVAKNVWSNVRP